MPQPPSNLPARVIDHEVSAFFGEAKRAGPWTPGTNTFVKATFADVNLDLREAKLPEGDEVTFDVEVLVSSVTITIPPTWGVIQEVEVLLGSYEEDTEPARDQPYEHIVRVTGRIRLGSLEIRRRMPGEGWLGAKKRRWKLRQRAKQKQLPSGE